MAGAYARLSALVQRGVVEHLAVPKGSITDALPLGKYLADTKLAPTGKFKLTGPVKDMVVPRAAAAEVLKIREIIKDPEALKGIFGFADKVNNLYRVGLTSYFPAFHGRNIFTNVLMNWFGGVNSLKPYAQMLEIQLGRGSPKLRRLMQIHGILDAGQMGEVGTFARTSFRGVEKATGPGRAIGRFAENNARGAHFIDKINKGWSPLEGAFSTKKWLFDYPDLTAIEKKFFRRGTLFYTFMRKNIPRQMEILITQPAKHAALFRLGLGEEEKGLVRPWDRGKLWFELNRGADPELRTMVSMGLSPEDLGSFSPEGRKGLPAVQRIGEKLLALTAPTIQIPLSMATGRSFRTGRDVSEENIVNSLWAKMPKKVRDHINLQAHKGRKGTFYTAAPWVRRLERSLPTSRLTGSLGQMLRADKTTTQKVLQLLAGIRVEHINVRDAEERYNKEIVERLTEQAIEKGLMKESRRAYPTLPPGHSEAGRIRRLQQAQ
jgi:hypothetical protein